MGRKTQARQVVSKDRKRQKRRLNSIKINTTAHHMLYFVLPEEESCYQQIVTAVIDAN